MKCPHRGGYEGGLGCRHGQRRNHSRGNDWQGGEQSSDHWQQLSPLPTPPQGAVRVILPTRDDKGLESIIDHRFGRAAFITVVDIVDRRPVSVVAVPNPYAMGSGGCPGKALVHWAVASRVNILISPHLGQRASMVLQQSGIRIVSAQPGARVIDTLRMNGLVV